jgi:zinc-ribbon family
MFFLFGTRRKAKVLGQMERHCAKCARPTVHSVIESRQWFTLFFISVVPLGSNYAVRCNLCGLAQKASPELKEQLSTKAAAALA